MGVESRPFSRLRRGIPMDDAYAPIPGKLPFELMREGRVELKQEQMRTGTHASRDLARVHAFTWAVLGDHAGLAEIHLVGDA